MASIRTDGATCIAPFPTETHPRAAGPYFDLHRRAIGDAPAAARPATALGESSSLPSLIYGLACRRSRTGLGNVNLIKTDGVLSADTSRRQNARIAGI